MKQSGGLIWVESSPGNGSRFDIYLPQALGPADSLPAEVPANQFVAHKETVLVVEDEPEVRELACVFLKSAGYRVLTAEDGLQALETAKRFGDSIQIVLADIVMPRMRGPDLAKELKTVLPHLKIVYMTGYLEQNGTDDYLHDAFFLQKPFSRETIVHQVAEAVKSSIQPKPQSHPVPA